MIETKLPLPQPVDREVLLPEADAPPAPGVRKKLMKLEAIRGFAAFYVTCYHTLPKVTVIAGREFVFFRFAQEAVILFFILSGFVIKYAYSISSDKSFKSFFLKRFLRIYIPLICVFALHYILLASQHNLESFSWTALFGNLLMLQQVNEMWNHSVLFRPFLEDLPLWSLSFEWWFYMIFFFVIQQFNSKASRIVYITGITAALSYIFYPFFLNRELMYLVIWWAGADVATLYISKKDITINNLRSAILSLSLITAIIGCNVFLYQRSHPGENLSFVSTPLVELRHFGFSLLALLIAIYWRKIKWTGFRYSLGLFQPLAPISFSLYISHWFLVSNAHYLDNYFSNIYVRSLLYFIICCLFCYVVERIIYPPISKKIMKCFSVKKKPFVTVS